MDEPDEQQTFEKIVYLASCVVDSKARQSDAAEGRKKPENRTGIQTRIGISAHPEATLERLRRKNPGWEFELFIGPLATGSMKIKRAWESRGRGLWSRALRGFAIADHLRRQHPISLVPMPDFIYKNPSGGNLQKEIHRLNEPAHSGPRPSATTSGSCPSATRPTLVAGAHMPTSGSCPENKSSCPSPEIVRGAGM